MLVLFMLLPCLPTLCCLLRQLRSACLRLQRCGQELCSDAVLPLGQHQA